MSYARISLCALFAFLGAVLAGLLLFDHYGIGPAESTVHQLCGAEEESGCEQVSRSRYSSVGSFSVAGAGLFFYASMLLLAAIGLSGSDAVRESAAGVLLVGFVAALLLDVVLFGIQAFAIGAFCKLCLGTYAVNLAAMFALLPARSKLKSSLSPAEARRALSVWAMGSFVLLVGVAAVDQAFASTSASPAQNLLGQAQAMDPEPEPPEPPPIEEPEAAEEAPAAEPQLPATQEANGSSSLQAELERAEARIRELQATLDDPEKYQAYQTQKATQEFEQQKPQDIALEGIPFKGPAEAPIRVVEYSDFLCPYCRNLAGALAGYMPQSQGRVAIYFKNYPLDQACNPTLSRTVHDGACELALGAICAHEQGSFWPYHDRVFSEPPPNPSHEDVVRIGSEAGLDASALRACLSSESARQKLDREIAEARRLEVSATPTVYVNGKKLSQIGGFLAAIESESRRLGLSPPNP